MNSIRSLFIQQRFNRGKIGADGIGGLSSRVTRRDQSNLATFLPQLCPDFAPFSSPRPQTACRAQKLGDAPFESTASEFPTGVSPSFYYQYAIELGSRDQK